MDEESVVKVIWRLDRSIKRSLDRLAISTGINGAEGRVIHFLLMNQDRDIFQKDLEMEFEMRPSTASELLKKMESKGYIVRESDKSDARLKKILVTDKSRINEDRIRKGVFKLEREAEGRLSKEDVETFKRISAEIKNNLDNITFDENL